MFRVTTLIISFQQLKLIQNYLDVSIKVLCYLQFLKTQNVFESY